MNMKVRCNACGVTADEIWERACMAHVSYMSSTQSMMLLTMTLTRTMMRGARGTGKTEFATAEFRPFFTPRILEHQHWILSNYTGTHDPSSSL